MMQNLLGRLFLSLQLFQSEMLARETTVAIVTILGLVLAAGALGFDSVLAMIFHCCNI